MCNMAGRNDVVISNVMTVMTQALAQAIVAMQGHQNHQGEADELHWNRFMWNNPPSFKGRYDPEGAYVWLQSIERSFRLWSALMIKR